PIETFKAYHLAAIETERLPTRAGFEDERDDAHADEVGAMDAFERLRNHGLDAKQVRTLRRPIARGAVAVLHAGEHHERHVVRRVALGGIVDEHALARRMMDRISAFD